MKHALSPDQVPLFARLATGRAMLAFDFDGTLAPIVVDRESAMMRTRTRELLTELCRLYPCAVISGRARGDVAARVIGADPKYVVGNHGAESTERGSDALAGEIEAVLPRLTEALRDLPGVEIEDKRYSLSIHFRQAPDQERTHAAISAAVATLPPALRATPGACVVNVVSRHARHKGDSFRELCEREQAEVALFVGDDTTDEDVFALPGSTMVSIRVGRSASSAARLYVRDQAEVDDLLALLRSVRASGVQYACR